MHSEFVHIHDCENPHVIRNKYTGQVIEVPCGKCAACQVKRITRLVPAILRESQCWKYCIFFTLTYQPKYRPYVYIPDYKVEDKFSQQFFALKERSEKYLSFCKGRLAVCQSSDVQKFIKRLRENTFRRFGLRSAIRYCISGDYGSTTFLPHYHGILWFNDERIASQIEWLIGRSWSVQSKTGEFEQIGRIDVQHAYSAARYVACYTQVSDARPPIFDFRDFRPRCQHSSSPSLGSLVRPLESVESIVNSGLTEVTYYDPESFQYRKQALSPLYVRRLFPQIPSFGSLYSNERYELYRICQQALDLDKTTRDEYFDRIYLVNSFFRDYITLGFSLTREQVVAKYDRLYYAFKRLWLQCSVLHYPLQEYDSLIERFRDNRKFKSLTKQNEYANQTSYPLEYVDLSVSKVDPFLIDHDYFVSRRNKFNKLIKRKCNNAYLELHPEYKQFHS